MYRHRCPRAWFGGAAWVSPQCLFSGCGGFRLTCFTIARRLRAFFVSAGLRGGRTADQYKARRTCSVQNIHRYFLLCRACVHCDSGYDAIDSYIWPTANGGHTFGEVARWADDRRTLLASIRSLHSLRHLVCGNIDCFSCVAGGRRGQDVKGATRLNETSYVVGLDEPVGVTLADLYVYMVASADSRFENL